MRENAAITDLAGEGGGSADPLDPPLATDLNMQQKYVCTVYNTSLLKFTNILKAL